MRTLACICLLMLLPVMAVGQTKVDSVLITDASYCKNLQVDDEASYSDARDKTAAETVETALFKALWYKEGGDHYYNARGALRFDLSDLDTTGYTIDSVIFKGWQESVSGAFNYTIVAGTTINDTINVNTYNDLFGWAASGAYSPVQLTNYSNQLTSNNYSTLKFTSAGVDTLEAHIGAGKPRVALILITKGDIENIAPTTGNHAWFSGAEDTGHEPRLLFYMSSTEPPAPAAAGDQIVGSRGAVLREAAGFKTDASTRNKKYISKARKRKKQ